MTTWRPPASADTLMIPDSWDTWLYVGGRYTRADLMRAEHRVILHVLSAGPKTYWQLVDALPDISRDLLMHCLQDLKDNGHVAATRLPGSDRNVWALA